MYLSGARKYRAGSSVLALVQQRIRTAGIVARRTSGGLETHVPVKADRLQVLLVDVDRQAAGDGSGVRQQPAPHALPAAVRIDEQRVDVRPAQPQETAHPAALVERNPDPGGGQVVFG